MPYNLEIFSLSFFIMAYNVSIDAVPPCFGFVRWAFGGIGDHALLGDFIYLFAVL
jgi:hypothetical protein